MLSIIDVSRHSSFHRTLAVTAYVLRWVHNVCKQEPKLSGPLSRVELEAAHRHLLKAIQDSIIMRRLLTCLKNKLNVLH